MLRSLAIVALAMLAAQAAAARPSRLLLQGTTEPAAINAARQRPVARIVAFQSHVSSTLDVQLALERLAMTASFQILSPNDVPDLHQASAEAATASGTLGKLALFRLTPADVKLLKASPDVAIVFSPPLTIKTPGPEASQAVGKSSANSFITLKKCSPVSGHTVKAATTVRLLQLVPCGRGTTDTVIYQGETCTTEATPKEPATESVRWMSATGPDGCTIKRKEEEEESTTTPGTIKREPNPDDTDGTPTKTSNLSAASAAKFNKDIFGDCGKAPAALAFPGSLGMRLCSSSSD